MKGILKMDRIRNWRLGMPRRIELLRRFAPQYILVPDQELKQLLLSIDKGFRETNTIPTGDGEYIELIFNAMLTQATQRAVQRATGSLERKLIEQMGLSAYMQSIDTPKDHLGPTPGIRFHNDLSGDPALDQLVCRTFIVLICLTVAIIIQHLLV